MYKNNINEGSFKQLWKVSSSLMIFFFSMGFLMFVDRLFLARYSIEALNAAASAGTLFWAGNFMWITLAAMAEVFVAQYNGSKQYSKIGEPVWQMIYLVGLSFIFFYSLSYFVPILLMKHNFFNAQEALYFRWNTYFAPFWTLSAALSAFYLGQGKTHIIKWMGLLGNLINLILDPLFIFGIDGWIRPMGIKGAAIATGIGVIIQVIIMGIMFLTLKNRLTFGTSIFRFRLSTFYHCLKIGAPSSAFILLELTGWAMFYIMMERISSKHMLVSSAAQSILTLFLFFGLALEKGSATVSANLIGANKQYEVVRVFKSGVMLSGFFGVFLMLTLGIFSSYIIGWFFKSPETLSSSKFIFSIEMLKEVTSDLRIVLALLIVYLSSENIRWLLSGILTSAGDTLFLMITGTISTWLFMLLPVYLFVMRPQADVKLAFCIWTIHSIITSSLLGLRFFRGKWKNKVLIEKASTHPT